MGFQMPLNQDAPIQPDSGRSRGANQELPDARIGNSGSSAWNIGYQCASGTDRKRMVYLS